MQLRVFSLIKPTTFSLSNVCDSWNVKQELQQYKWNRMFCTLSFDEWCWTQCLKPKTVWIQINLPVYLNYFSHWHTIILPLPMQHPPLHPPPMQLNAAMYSRVCWLWSANTDPTKYTETGAKTDSLDQLGTSLINILKWMQLFFMLFQYNWEIAEDLWFN